MGTTIINSQNYFIATIEDLVTPSLFEISKIKLLILTSALKTMTKVSFKLLLSLERSEFSKVEDWQNSFKNCL